jgi:hypothetical protein
MTKNRRVPPKPQTRSSCTQIPACPCL